MRARETLAVLVSTALAFVIAEGSFRVYLRHRARADLERVAKASDVTTVDTCNLGDMVRLSREPDLFYELKPNLHGRFCGGAVTTNALGMRMPNEPVLEKPAGVVRVVGLGDSYLFAQRMDDGHGFLEVLRSRAREAGKPIEFLNFGVPGYNTWMEGVVLAKRARYFAPDVIVVAVTGNDWDLPSFMLSRPYGDIAHSFLLGSLVDRLRPPPKLVSTPQSKVFEHHYLAVPSEVPSEFRHMVGFEAYRRALHRMLDIAGEVDAKLVLFSDCITEAGPGTRSCTFPYAAGEYERIRREVYADRRVVICSWQLRQEQLIPDDGHPNTDGHLSLADQLSTCLDAHGVRL